MVNYSLYDPELEVEEQLVVGKAVKIGRRMFRDFLAKSEKRDRTPIDPHYISRIHAVIDLTAEKPYFSALSKTNPTFLNGKEVVSGTSVMLENLDVIRMGPWGLEFLIKTEDLKVKGEGQ